MPEILTESFCERCGTRYTFESVAPRKARRLGQFKTLSRGVKNWVLSDDSSLDEALAAARGDQEREVTTQQLDAFHSTFNFCMSCRQYTCANCWNEVEGRCLSCAPGIAQEILQAPVPSPFAAGPAEATRLDVGAWPETDLSGPAAPPTNVWGFPEPTTPTSGNGSNGAANGHSDSAETPAVEAEDDLPSFDAAARLAFLAGEEVPAADAGAGEQGATGGAEETIGDPWRDLDDRAARALTETDAAALEAESLAAAAAATIADASGTEVEDEAAAGANRTTELLSRFRPGQSIDDALAAYEADLEFRRLDEEVASEPPSVPVAEAEPEALAEALPEIEQIGTLASDLPEAFAAEPAPPAREPEIVAAVADAILTDDAPRALPVVAAPEGADVEAGSADEPLAVEREPVEREPVAAAPEADEVAVEPVAAPEADEVAVEPVSVAREPVSVAPEADEVAVEPVAAPEADEAAVEPVAVAPDAVAAAPEADEVAPEPVAAAPDSDEVAVEPVAAAPKADEVAVGPVADEPQPPAATLEMIEEEPAFVSAATAVTTAHDSASESETATEAELPVAATADDAAPADAAPPEAQSVAAPDIEAPAELMQDAAAAEAEDASTPTVDEAPPRHDQIEQPTWRIFAPEQASPTPAAPAAQPVQPRDAPVAPAVQASSEPQWPARAGVQDSPSMLLLADRARATSDAMWAASAREVVAGPAGAAPASTVGVRPCANCGLSLSATARFCRRCGTQQG